MSLRSNRLLNWNHFVLFQTTPMYQKTGRGLRHSLCSTKLQKKDTFDPTALPPATRFSIKILTLPQIRSGYMKNVETFVVAMP